MGGIKTKNPLWEGDVMHYFLRSIKLKALVQEESVSSWVSFVLWRSAWISLLTFNLIENHCPYWFLLNCWCSKHIVLSVALLCRCLHVDGFFLGLVRLIKRGKWSRNLAKFFVCFFAYFGGWSQNLIITKLLCTCMLVQLTNKSTVIVYFVHILSSSIK